MTRAHGRCARGQRLVAKAPFGKWRTLTFLAALRCDGLTAPCVIDGPINGASFRAMSSRFSRPSSRRTTLSLWTTSAAIRAAPFAPRSAPPKPSSSSCPPTRRDLNPIEQAFAKMKTLLRKADAGRSNRPGEPSAPCSTATLFCAALKTCNPQSYDWRLHMRVHRPGLLRRAGRSAGLRTRFGCARRSLTSNKPQ